MRLRVTLGGTIDMLVVCQRKEEVPMDVTMIQHPMGQGGMLETLCKLNAIAVVPV